MDTRIVLTVTAGPLTGQKYVMKDGSQVRIGRARDCAVRLLQDITVSREHCQVDVDGLTAWAQDLGSLNGTFINGEPIGQRRRGEEGEATMRLPPSRPLAEGDELRIGATVFRVDHVAQDLVEDNSGMIEVCV